MTSNKVKSGLKRCTQRQRIHLIHFENGDLDMKDGMVLQKYVRAKSKLRITYSSSC